MSENIFEIEEIEFWFMNFNFVSIPQQIEYNKIFVNFKIRRLVYQEQKNSLK